jgi:sedoheptulokinase
VPENAKAYCTIHDLFVMQLCGLKAAKVHISDAASFGLFDLESGSFSNGFAPKIENGFAIAGNYKNIPVSVAIGDNQASVFSTLKDENDLLINVGTGSQVSIISDKVVSGENLETRPYFENKFLIVGAALCGGRAYSVLKNFYKEVLCFTGDFSDEKNFKFTSCFRIMPIAFLIFRLRLRIL